MPAPVIALFPGQTSRDADMIARLAECEPGLAEEATEMTTAALGRSLDLGFERNADVQVGVFATTLAYLRLCREVGLQISASAGLSLGEYAHLTAIGALTDKDALGLVAARGREYDVGPQGHMAVAQPVSVAEAEKIIADLRRSNGWGEADLAISNDNGPKQCVVAGSDEAVEAFIDTAEDELFAQCIVIEKRVPMHTARFRPTVDIFRPALLAAGFREPKQNYWPNVTATPIANPRSNDIVDLLSRHVCERVRWRETIDALNARYPDAIFVEVGPKSILGDILKRRWIGKDRVISLDDGSGIAPRQRLTELVNAQ